MPRPSPAPIGTPGRIYRFGIFELDTRTAELRRKGLRIRVQEQPLRVLTALVERAGELVTREELHRLLWPDDTFVDFDTGLNTAVRKLRETLKDPAYRPKFIETVPRRGYRFACDVALFEPAGKQLPPLLFPAGAWLETMSAAAEDTPPSAPQKVSRPDPLKQEPGLDV